MAEPDAAVADVVNKARKTVIDDPQSAEAWGNLGMAFAANRQDEQAVKSLAQAEALDPDEGRWPYIRGVMLMNEHPEDALAALSRGVALLAKDVPAVRIQLAGLLLKLGKLDDAEREYRTALAADKTDTDARFGLGKIFVTRGQWPEAVVELTLAMNEPRTRVPASVLLAGAKSHLDGKPEENVGNAATALAMSRNIPIPDPVLYTLRPLRVGLMARLEQAEHLLDEGKPQAALPDLHALTLDYPKSENVWRTQAEALLALGNPEEAEASTRSAIKLNPNSSESLKQWGDELLRLRRPEEAADALRHAIKLRSNDAVAHERLGTCLWLLKQPDSAIDEYRTAIKLRPDRGSAYLRLADALQELGRKDEAIVALNQALLIDPKNAAAKDSLRELNL